MIDHLRHRFRWVTTSSDARLEALTRTMASLSSTSERFEMISLNLLQCIPCVHSFSIAELTILTSAP